MTAAFIIPKHAISLLRAGKLIDDFHSEIPQEMKPS